MKHEEKVYDGMEFIYSGKELMQLPDPSPQRFVIEGILESEVTRPAILAAKSGMGKSTLATQVCFCVASGQSFFGRRTRRGPVLLWQCEGSARKVKAALKALGYDPTKHENIAVFAGYASANTVGALEAALKNRRETVLCVVETVEDLLRFSDSNSSSSVREGLEHLDKLIRGNPQCAFLLLSQFRKRIADEKGDQIAGSYQFSARTDSKWFLTTVSATDRRRVFSTQVRDGADIPETILTFDPVTKRSELGALLSAEKKLEFVEKVKNVEGQIIEYVAAHDQCDFDECLPRIKGASTKLKWAALKKLIDQNTILRTRTGKKGDPYKYSCAGLLTEEVAA